MNSFILCHEWWLDKTLGRQNHNNRKKKNDTSTAQYSVKIFFFLIKSLWHCIMVVALSSFAGFWENVRPLIPCIHFIFIFVFKVEISSCTLIPLFMQGSVHSGSVSWDDCGWMFSDNCLYNIRYSKKRYTNLLKWMHTT